MIVHVNAALERPHLIDRVDRLQADVARLHAELALQRTVRDELESALAQALWALGMVLEDGIGQERVIEIYDRIEPLLDVAELVA